MTGNLAQIISLTGFGNNLLKNKKLPNDFVTSNMSFQFCRKVDFREVCKMFLFKKNKEKIIARNPTEWFSYLELDSCKKLSLYFEHSNDQSFARDHKLAGLVGGGGTWLIEAVYNGYSKFWQSRWEVKSQNSDDKRIWTVSYGTIDQRQSTIDLQFNIDEIKEKLNSTLSEIADFAFRKNLEGWGNQFAKAKAVLNSLTPEKDYHRGDLIPIEHYSLIARQLIFSAGTAWVFGGMGSWNDLGFEYKKDNDSYNRLSEQLYSIINKAIISGVNTS